MKSLRLFICMILTVGYLSTVQAVTDAELEALEKQIEQQEAEEEAKKKAEAKRKAEQKRKTEVEAEKKRLVEIEKLRQEEQRRLTELERKRKEEQEAKKKSEEDKKAKFDTLISEAEQAVNNKDKELAINKYNEALTLYPGDTVAMVGVKEAEKLMDKICYEVLGQWDYDYFGGGTSIFNEDGTIDGSWDKWECINSKQRLFRMYGKAFGTDVAEDLRLSEDGECLLYLRTSICYRRPGYKKK